MIANRERDLYINIKPIDKRTMEQIRKMTARYIYVADKEGNAKCECCGDIKVENTKHLGKAICPKCKKEREVIHTWRRSWNESIEWGLSGLALDSHTILMRYVKVERVNGDIVDFTECAREVVDFNRRVELPNHYNKYMYHKLPCFEYKTDDYYSWCVCKYTKREWKATRGTYFRKWNMGYSENKLCCLYAQPTTKFWSELRKIDNFKYLDLSVFRNGNLDFDELLYRFGRKAGLYEKLQKIGLDNLIAEDVSHDVISYDKKQTSLVKMLKIDKQRYNRWLSSPSTEMLYLCQNISSLSVIDGIVSTGIGLKEAKELIDNGMCTVKVANYIAKHSCSVREYAHYIDLLKKCNFPLDNSYLYPTDFRKADEVVTKAYEIQKHSAQDSLIKELSDSLRKLKGIKELAKGSNGFLVYVPESYADLYNEGKALHNCIGTYGDRLAEHKTILFFIRRLESPEAPFVAMEYCHGSIVQVRYDRNEDVRTSKKEGSDKVIAFAEALEKILVENNILVA